MGREIRRVPPNWKHPRHTTETTHDYDNIGEYISMRDVDYETAAEAWIREFHEFEADPNHPWRAFAKYFWEYASPPDEDLCRPKFTEEPTWFQVYETVSEGTPVSPPFATQEELARYLADNGDFWCQNRNQRGMTEAKPTYEQALKFVQAGHAFSMTVQASANGNVFSGPYQQ